MDLILTGKEGHWRVWNKGVTLFDLGLQKCSPEILKKEKKKKLLCSVNISIQMQALVLKQRISENYWDLDWLVVYQEVVILPAMWNNGIMTCRSSVITLKNTLDHCKRKFQLDTCLEFCLLSLLSLVIPPTSRQLQVYSSCSLPAR